MTYKKAEKRTPMPFRPAMKANILRLANLIREGEEEYTEEYNTAVMEFADLTRSQAPASETDPIAWDAFVEDCGCDPGEIIYCGGRRGLNYLEMVKFQRGWWR